MNLRGLAPMAFILLVLLSGCSGPAAQQGASASTPGLTTTPTNALPTATSEASQDPSASPLRAVTTSDPFGGYTLELPEGTARAGAEVGRWGETRTTYTTPAGESVTTIDLAPSFGWSELSEELSSSCPGSLEGEQFPIQWAGSNPGGYTGWDRSSCNQPDVVTFVDFDEQAVVIHSADSTSPPAWMVSAVEKARRVSGLDGQELQFLLDHRNDRNVDLEVWAEACAAVFGTAEEIATTFALDTQLSGEIYGNGGPVCEYGPLWFGIQDVEADIDTWTDFDSDDCRFQDVAVLFYECRSGEVSAHAGLRQSPTENDRAQLRRITKDVRDQLAAR